MDFIKGNKTYIIAIAMGIATAMNTAGLIDTATFQTIMAFLGSGGLATLRHAMTPTKPTL